MGHHGLAVTTRDLNDLTIFARVAAEQSVTRAAQRLGMPKSTVSRRLSLLEDRLKVRLVTRTPRIVSLTDAGRALHAQISPALAILDSAEASVTEQAAAPQGPLRIGAPRDFGVAVCAPVLASFARIQPAIPIDLHLTDRVVDFAAEGFDLVIRVGILKDAALVARPVMSIGGGLVASPAYLSGRAGPTKPEELSAHSCIVFNSAPHTSRWHLLGPRGATLHIDVVAVFAANSLPVVRRAALDGHGIARLPDYICEHDIAAGRLVRVLPAWSVARRTVYLVHAGRRNAPRRLHVLIDHLLSTLRPGGALDA